MIEVYEENTVSQISLCRKMWLFFDMTPILQFTFVRESKRHLPLIMKIV